MIERWTVDQLAIAIEEQVQTAQPRPKLLRRFFVSGKRDGKRGRHHEPVRAYLTEGVSIASSRIAEQYIATDAEKSKQLEGLKLRIEQHPASEADEQTTTQTTDTASDTSAPSGGPDTSSVPDTHELPSDEDLNAALGALAAARAAKEAAKQAAVAEQQRVELAGLKEQQAVLESELESLADQFRQMIESCHGVGRFLWARYCHGYVHGLSRSRKAELPEPPDVAIEFDVPEILHEMTAPAAAASGAGSE
jgi:hypothetical protein